MNKRYIIIIILYSLVNFQLLAQSENKLLGNFPDEYLVYAQEDYFILDYFSLDKDYKVAFIGGERGTYSVLLNKENLISDTFKVNQGYLRISALLSLNEEKYLATTDVGLLSFKVSDSKITNMVVVIPKEKNRYDLASVNEKTLYMKPKDVIQNKLKWRISSKDKDEILYESDSKFKDFKNVQLPNVWNRIYYMDSVFVFNDPLNNKILTYNPINGYFKTYDYPSSENELRFLYYDTVNKKSYLVGFENATESYKIYEYNFLKPDQYLLRKTINHLYPPKSIHDHAVFVENAFLEGDKNCIVRIPLD